MVQEGELKLHLGTAYFLKIGQIALGLISGRDGDINEKEGTFMNEKEWLDYFRNNQ